MPCPGKDHQCPFSPEATESGHSAVYNEYKVPAYYDSMILKLIVHDRDRDSAIRKMRCPLENCIIEGIDTNLDFQYRYLPPSEV